MNKGKRSRGDYEKGLGSGLSKRQLRRKRANYIKRIVEEVSIPNSSSESEYSNLAQFSDSEPSNAGSRLNFVNEEVNQSLDSCSDISSEIFDRFDDTFSSDSDSSSSSSSNLSDISQDIRNWALTYGIDTVRLNSLLLILRNHGHKQLPKDSRTLLFTKRLTTGITKINSGEYWHIGFKQGITEFLCSNPNYSHSLTFAINIDGIPLFKSSNKNFWPILAAVYKYPYGIVSDVFPVGIFCGDSKPGSLAEYLEPLLEELGDLNYRGFSYGTETFKCLLNGPYILDTPARSFVKKTKGHTGFYSCDKCTIRGYRSNRRTIFLPSNENDDPIKLRNNESFRYQENEEHHLVGPLTPLERLDMDLVKQFPLDYMHLVCLGVMRRMLNFMVKKGKHIVRLSSQMILDFSTKLDMCKKHIPSEFARKPRSLRYIDRWKATELRQFLLYTGPILGEGILPDCVLAKAFKNIFYCYLHSSITHFK